MQSKINSFIKGTIKGNELRRTYYHIARCEECKEVLLDEFSFYTTFNDLDNDLNFNYEKKLNEILENIRKSIEEKDYNLRRKYILLSIAICIILVIIVAIAIRIVYR